MARTIIVTARVWRRIAAFIIDLFIVAIVCSLLLMINSGNPQSWTELLDYTPSSTQVAVSAYFALFIFLYHLFCEYIIGQTAGMMLLGINVARTDKTKEELPRFGQAFLRNLFLFPLIPSIVQGLVWVAELGYYLFVGRRFFEAVSKTDTVENR